MSDAPLTSRLVPDVDYIMRRCIPEPNSGCWLWDGATTSQGYGRANVGRKIYNIPRVAYGLFKGSVPEGMSVLHKCNTPACTNPDHLFLGTLGWRQIKATKLRAARWPKTAGMSIAERIFHYAIPEPNSGCWLWIGGLQGKGYGSMCAHGAVSAHRASYIEFKGPIPAGRVVCHKCDTPACVNPDHLWLGTIKDNNRDCIAKGRFRKESTRPGRKNGSAKLTAAAAESIRARHVRGTSPKALLKEFGISQVQFYRILRNESWPSAVHNPLHQGEV